MLQAQGPGGSPGDLVWLEFSGVIQDQGDLGPHSVSIGPNTGSISVGTGTPMLNHDPALPHTAKVQGQVTIYYSVSAEDLATPKFLMIRSVSSAHAHPGTSHLMVSSGLGGVLSGTPQSMGQTGVEFIPIPAPGGYQKTVNVHAQATGHPEIGMEGIDDIYVGASSIVTAQIVDRGAWLGIDPLPNYSAGSAPAFPIFENKLGSSPQVYDRGFGRRQFFTIVDYVCEYQMDLYQIGIWYIPTTRSWSGASGTGYRGNNSKSLSQMRNMFKEGPTSHTVSCTLSDSLGSFPVSATIREHAPIEDSGAKWLPDLVVKADHPGLDGTSLDRSWSVSYSNNSSQFQVFELSNEAAMSVTVGQMTSFGGTFKEIASIEYELSKTVSASFSTLVSTTITVPPLMRTTVTILPVYQMKHPTLLHFGSRGYAGSSEEVHSDTQHEDWDVQVDEDPL